VSLGIAPQRLKTISYGEEKPLDTANNEMAWAKNRRAEFKLLN
jgi:peptidoglycan-associated lipoprotein